MSFLTEFFIDEKRFESELLELDMSVDERSRIKKTISEIAQLRLIDRILIELDEEDKQLFVEQLHGGSSEIIVEMMRDKIQDVENILRKESKKIEDDIINDIKQLRKTQK